MSEIQNPTTRTRVVREADRAVYDREEANRILDEGFLCHVGFVADGHPFVIPTSYGRKDASLYIHGSAASRMLRNLKEGVRFASPSRCSRDSYSHARFSITP
jgi:hypothetical protein